MKTRRRQAIRSLSAAIALLLAACSYIPTTDLRYHPIAVSPRARSEKSLAVLPFTEGRGPRRYPGLQGRLFLTYIPLVPYIKVAYERLDESRLLHVRNRGGGSRRIGVLHRRDGA